MLIGPRTLLRHLGVILALTAVVPMIMRALGADLFAMLAWLLRHAAFLGAWAAACLALGSLAYLLTRQRRLQRGLLALLASLRGRAFALATFRAYRAETLGPLPRGILAWASCPRCVSYWFGACFSLVVHALYWPGWQGAVYFGAYGASLAAVASVSAVLLAVRRMRERD